MRGRAADAAKSPVAAKKSPPGRKPGSAKCPPSAKTTPPSATELADSAPEVAAPKSSGVKRGPVPKPQPAQPVDAVRTTPESPPPAVADLKPEVEVEEAKLSDESTQIKLATSNPPAASPPKKVTRRVVKKKIVRAKTPAAKFESAPAPRLEDDNKVKIEESQIEEQGIESIDVKVVEPSMKEESVLENSVDIGEKDLAVGLQIGVEGESPNKGKAKINEVVVFRETANTEVIALQEVEKAAEEEEPNEEVEHKVGQSEEVEDDLPITVEADIEGNAEVMDEDVPERLETEAHQLNEDEEQEPEEMVEFGDEEAFLEPGDEEFQDDDRLDLGDDAKASEMENMELTAAAEERKIRKELEVFVAGLDCDVEEDDMKKAFEKIGEVVEVRLLKDPATNKSRGFAFVRFATKEQAGRALSEMKNPVICGKRCGTAPSEDNDTLFVGNICNTWTKEAIKQKLKDYGVEGIEHITLVQDSRHEGLSRGFCFIQFSCHADAMLAYKRLQKPDVILGHGERTAKVAFAEPMREPDPEVMAKVKSVFVDGLPPYWDEDRVREHFKTYGEIERIMLARNMSTAKRKDFGFVDFATHEAAIACIEDINSKELVDGKSKAKVKARLSNPSPKTQAVKGGMCGGFRVGRGGAINLRGRGFMRGALPFNQLFHYGRGFYPHARNQFYDPARSYVGYHERHTFGFDGRRAPLRAGHQIPVSNATSRPNYGGQRHGEIGRGLGRPVPPCQELPSEEVAYAGPSVGGHFDDPYLYDGRGHGMKRPLYMSDQEVGYMEQRGVYPRFDYGDAGRGNRYRVVLIQVATMVLIMVVDHINLFVWEITLLEVDEVEVEVEVTTTRIGHHGLAWNSCVVGQRPTSQKIARHHFSSHHLLFCLHFLVTIPFSFTTPLFSSIPDLKSSRTSSIPVFEVSRVCLWNCQAYLWMSGGSSSLAVLLPPVSFEMMAMFGLMSSKKVNRPHQLAASPSRPPSIAAVGLPTFLEPPGLSGSDASNYTLKPLRWRTKNPAQEENLQGPWEYDPLAEHSSALAAYNP
ncbi:hypothetical protein Dimus_014116 [Dionaea muscipula]